MTAPIPRRIDSQRVHHDDVFIDPYEWMRDKSDPEVIAHLEAENAHVEAQTADQEPLRQKIFDEIKSRTKETDLSVPVVLVSSLFPLHSTCLVCLFCTTASRTQWSAGYTSPGVPAGVDCQRQLAHSRRHVRTQRDARAMIASLPPPPPLT